MKKLMLPLAVMLAAGLELQARETPNPLFDRLYLSRSLEFKAALSDLPVPETPAAKAVGESLPQETRLWPYVWGPPSRSFSSLDLPVPKSPAPGSVPTVLARIDMNAELDKYLLSDVTFRTAKGKVVHVSVNVVWQCPDGRPAADSDCAYRESIIFLSDDGQLFAAPIGDIANVTLIIIPVRQGRKDIYFDGGNQPYTVKLHVGGLDMSAVKNGVLEITSQGRNVFRTKLGQAAQRMLAKATPVQMKQKYFVFPARMLYADKSGACRLGPSENLVLIPDTNGQSYYLYPIPVSKITPQGVPYLLDPPWNDPYYFRMTSGNVIEIYHL